MQVQWSFVISKSGILNGLRRVCWIINHTVGEYLIFYRLTLDLKHQRTTITPPSSNRKAVTPSTTHNQSRSAGNSNPPIISVMSIDPQNDVKHEEASKTYDIIVKRSGNYTKYIIWQWPFDGSRKSIVQDFHWCLASGKTDYKGE